MKHTEHKLSDLLGGALQRAGITREVAAAVVVQAADEALEAVFGQGVLEAARAHTFADEVLTFVSSDAAFAQEIRLRESALLADIVRRVPRVTIREVQVWHKSSPRRGAAWYDPSGI